MPSSADIVASLANIANAALPYAVAWHVAVAAGLLSLLAGFRTTERAAALFSVGPVASVSALAWTYGVLFNGVVFTLLALALVSLAVRARDTAMTISSGWPAWLGVAMIAFAWFYPHFLGASHSLFAYAYAAPMGLLPCPTLSLVVGLMLLFGVPAGRVATRLLSVTGAFYAIWGVVRLGVFIDLVLLAGVVGLFFARGRSRMHVRTHAMSHAPIKLTTR